MKTEISPAKIILETERLLLREITPEDAEIMFALNADPEVIRYTGDEAFESVAAAKHFLEEYRQVYRDYGYGRWGVVLKDNGTLVGWCGLRRYKKDEDADLGFRFFRKDWGKGYASESAMACVKYGIYELNLPNITGRARVENVASLRVLEKCGLKKSGEGEDCGGKIFIYELFPGRSGQLPACSDCR